MKAITNNDAAATAGCPYMRVAGDVEGTISLARKTLAEFKPGVTKLGGVEAALKQALQLDPTDRDGFAGQAYALLAVTYGHMQDWNAALDACNEALKRDPQNPTLKAMQKQAATNIRSDIKNEPPVYDVIDPAPLLRPVAEQLRIPDLGPLGAPPKASWSEVVGDYLSHLTGSAIGVIVGAYTGFMNRKGTEGPWNDMMNNGNVTIPNLLATRAGLDKKMHSAYRGDELVDNQPPDQKKPWQYEVVPSATGAWRYPTDPRQLATFNRIGSLGKEGVDVRVNRAMDDTLPNPFLVSQALLHPEPGAPRATAPFLNKAAIAWIQPFVHDLINHRLEDVTADPYVYELPKDHPIRVMTGQTHITVPRTQADRSADADPNVYRNEVAPAWDTSEVYGSDQATQDRLRTDPATNRMLENGKLYLPDGLLPIDPLTGREMSGMTRNWWTGPQMFQTLFARHHNFVCDQLAAAYPGMSSDWYYGKAKLVVAGIKVRIHTGEWTPAVLCQKAISQGLNTNAYGLFQATFTNFEDRRMYRGWRPDDPIFGLVGGRCNDNETRYTGEVEEFPFAYQLHEAMPDKLGIWKIGDAEPSRTVDINETREKGARNLLTQEGFATLFNSLGHEKMEALVNNNLPEFMTHMTIGNMMAIDIGANDIIRARERGSYLTDKKIGTGYNQHLIAKGMPPIERFEDLRCDAKTVAKLYEIYGPGPEGVAKLDLKVGTRCDRRRPMNGFDMEMFAVFEKLASIRIAADPWLTTKFKPRFYTRRGLELIDRIPVSAFDKSVRAQEGAIQGPNKGTAPVTLRNLLLLHAPEWKDSDNVKNDIRNFFEPHNTTYAQAPQEHPLRAFEKYRGLKRGQ